LARPAEPAGQAVKQPPFSGPPLTFAPVLRRRFRRAVVRYHIRRRVYRFQRRATRNVMRRIGL